ncbi:MAG: Wzz/FepE/Etk N-terminal domain-containing protein [Blastocatellia bacterium]
MNMYSQSQTETWLDSENLLRAVRQVLWARKWLILGTTLLTFALTATATYLMKPVYTSSASLLIQKERFDAAVTPEQIIATGQPDRRLTEEELNSEVEILNSPSLLEEVVRRLELDKEFTGQQRNSVLAKLSKESLDEKFAAVGQAVIQLQNNLTAEPGKKSNLIKITYKANDRQQAARVVNTLCEVYQERHIRLRQGDGSQDFFVQQAEAMRQRLNEKEEALKRLSPLPNAQLLNQQIETQMRQLNEFEVAWQNTRTAIAESEARTKSLSEQIAKEPERLQTEERIARRSAPDTVRAQLFALEMRRAELLNKYQGNHRLIRDLDKDLEKARRMVELVEKAPAESAVTSSLNPLRQRLIDSLTTERSNLASLQEKERSLATIIQQAKGKARELGLRGYEQRRLDRERDLADQAYQLYAKKGEEGRISTALDKEGIINIKVAEPAQMPYRATSPNVPLNLIVGLIGGLILGLAATFTLEYFAPTTGVQRPLAMTGKYIKTSSQYESVR